MVQLAAVISVRQVYVGQCIRSEDVCVRLMRCMHIVSSKFMAVVSLSSSVQLSLHTEEEVLPPTMHQRWITASGKNRASLNDLSINLHQDFQGEKRS